MEKNLDKNSNKSIYEMLKDYIDDLYVKGYTHEEIACALEQYGKGLIDDDVKIATSVSDINVKKGNSEHHYKIVRLKDVGELPYPVYFMCGNGDNIEALPLIWKGYSIKDCAFSEALDQRCYLYEDMNEKDREKYKDKVEIFASKHPIQKSALLGLVSFQKEKSKRRKLK